jgi:hypothetical protein
MREAGAEARLPALRNMALMEFKDYAAGVFGLAGVIVGAGLTTLKDVYLQARKDRKTLQYLAVQVGFALDDYVRGAVNVVCDDGLDDGQRDEQGCLQPTAQYPVIRPETFEVEWTSLPADLMHEVFDLPIRTKDAISAIGQVAEYGVGPPDYEDFFEERVIQFSSLGLHAATLADRIWDIAGLPSRRSAPGWDPIEELQARSARAKDRRVARESRRGKLAF